MLDFFKRDYILAGISLATIFLWVPLDTIYGYEWASYMPFVAVAYPAYLFVTWSIYAIKRTFFNKKNDN